MHLVVVIAALLLLLPGVAAAGEFEELVLLRGDVSFDLVDARDNKRVSDAFVDDVLMGAANELGLFLRPGAPAPDHIKLTIDELACTEAGCRVQLDGVLVSPTGSEPFAVDESTRDGIAALEPLVQEALLLELSALTSVATALERASTESPKILRYGWLTRADGTRVHGAVAEDPGGGVCVVRDGSATPVAMEDLAEVDVRDVHLLGAKPGMDWAVTRFDGARIVGGTVVERTTDRDDIVVVWRERDHAMVEVLEEKARVAREQAAYERDVLRTALEEVDSEEARDTLRGWQEERAAELEERADQNDEAAERWAEMMGE